MRPTSAAFGEVLTPRLTFLSALTYYGITTVSQDKNGSLSQRFSHNLSYFRSAFLGCSRIEVREVQTHELYLPNRFRKQHEELLPASILVHDASTPTFPLFPSPEQCDKLLGNSCFTGRVSELVSEAVKCAGSFLSQGPRYKPSEPFAKWIRKETSGTCFQFWEQARGACITPSVFNELQETKFQQFRMQRNLASTLLRFQIL